MKIAKIPLSAKKKDRYWGYNEIEIKLIKNIIIAILGNVARKYTTGSEEPSYTSATQR